ncbi:cell division protein SepF [Aeromicrobium sp. CTD01-1L150]|uniref:cell division protein SepF n=1 Tax=Aeromicrobium sp. CTD01-1L150 TaxID=3341830 RepID=UPI0035BF504C
MAGAMRKVGEYLGLVEEADFEDWDDEPAQSEPSSRERARRSERAERPAQAPAPVAKLEDRRSPRPTPRPEPHVEQASMLARIETVTPRTYNDARSVGEHYRSGVPVIMNLSEIDDDDAKRLVDFAAGLVFAVHGTINRVTSKVFLLSPENIEVTDEDKQRIAAGGFYNQS